MGTDVKRVLVILHDIKTFCDTDSESITNKGFVFPLNSGMCVFIKLCQI